MKSAIRLISILLIPFAASGANAEDATVEDSSTVKAMAVVERSKSTRVTYSMYSWNRISLPGEEPIEEWAAEFHSGAMHRVETPNDRVIADCDAGTGIHRSLVSGETVEGREVALTACGIDTNSPFVEAGWIKRVKTRFGNADRVRLVDAENVRHYDVSDQGVLVGATIASRERSDELLLNMETIAVLDTLPAGDLFDRESLERSFVPEHYKRKPVFAGRKSGSVGAASAQSASPRALMNVR